jgi:transcription initiation factor TFIIF subunit alpha
MKFSASGERTVDPGDEQTFVRPVRLNRKDPRTVRRLTDQDRERFNQRARDKAALAVGVDLMQLDDDDQHGRDDKEGIIIKGEQGEGEGEDRDEVNKDKEQLDPTLVGRGTTGLTTGSRQRGPGGMFKKKTRRVFVASEESRRLKREEWQPWVLEDDEGQERWVGRLEGGAGEVELNPQQQQQQQRGGGNAASLKGWRPAANASDAGGGGSSYVAFVFGENGDEFQVVPINRWYKFNQGPKYLTLAEEEAEEEVSNSRTLSLSPSCAH